jgi:hypothetical protein
VLLRIYTHCLDGGGQEARERIQQTLEAGLTSQNAPGGFGAHWGTDTHRRPVSATAAHRQPRLDKISP